MPAAAAAAPEDPLAALVGGGGLGRFVVDGFGRQDPTLMFAGVVLVAITCVVVELVGSAVQRALTPRALRGGTVLGTF